MKTAKLPRRLVLRLNSWVFVGVLMILGVVVAAPLHSVYSGSTTKTSKVTDARKNTTPALPAFRNSMAPSNMFSFVPPPTAPAVATFASDCTTAQTVFSPGDVICAHVTGAQAGWQLIWSNASFIAVQTNTINSATQDISLTLAPNASRGDWRVIIFDPFGGTVQAVTTFTVADVQNPLVDVQVQKVQASSQTSVGSQVVFNILVRNAGPNNATNVVLSDAVPANTTFTSFNQLTGPVFSCTNPNEGESGTTTCTIASMAKDDVATFIGTYTVGSAPSGSSIDNTATVANDIADSNSSNDSATASVPVLSAPCVLTCPTNITQDADAGQAGAIVNYAAPSSTGDCGQPVVDPETGNTIPPISCSPASGSFFGVGTTPVICSAQQSGAVCTFEVIINNPGGLTITLNGPSTVSIECGDDFNDPGASAVNANGQSVPVTITLPSGFNPDAPAIGSYSLTYTATEDVNSVSTTRTVNVADTKAPVIAINGSNPYKIEQGTCLPFVDPGVSADDGCAGKVPVSSSISGPGGLTHVDTTVAGTYTITYTATDGTRSATATRTVLVGHFPPEEEDLGTSNGAPVIRLNGGDPDTGAITVECGFFVDPGATATDTCGVPLPYTVTGSVLNAPGTYLLTYTVTDNSQSASVTRAVTITADNTAPTITVNGANPLTVECHGTLTDPGATAHDKCAGDFAATADTSGVNVNAVGTYVITYTATDATGHAAVPVTRTVNVVDTTPPVFTTCPAGRSANADASCQAVVPDFTGSAVASDLCGGSAVTITQSPAAGTVVTVGATAVTLTATDAYNNSSTCQTTFTVVDATPPTLTLNGLAPSLWPPNHSYHTFNAADFVASASDNCDSTVTKNSVYITKVTSDEAENGNGSGNTLNDIVIAGDCKSVQLRAEREGGGNGRVYTLDLKVKDSAGNYTTAVVKVIVPHNPGETVVDNGAHYTVVSGCP